VVDRYEIRSKDERVDIRKHVGDYVRLYSFLSQVITFGDASLEKFYQFTRHLLRKLRLPDDPLPREITKDINMASYRIQQTSSGTIKLMDEDGQLKPISALGTGRPQQEDQAPLSQIIEYINDHFGTDFTNADKVKFFAENMGRRLEDQEGLRRALDTGVNPSEETRKLAFDTFFGDTLEDMIDSDFDIYKKIKDDPGLRHPIPRRDVPAHRGGLAAPGDRDLMPDQRSAAARPPTRRVIGPLTGGQPLACPWAFSFLRRGMTCV
jgi:type I restriction enzyme R subunit